MFESSSNSLNEKYCIHCMIKKKKRFSFIFYLFLPEYHHCYQIQIKMVVENDIQYMYMFNINIKQTKCNYQLCLHCLLLCIVFLYILFSSEQRECVWIQMIRRTFDNLSESSIAKIAWLYIFQKNWALWLEANSNVWGTQTNSSKEVISVPAVDQSPGGPNPNWPQWWFIAHLWWIIRRDYKVTICSGPWGELQ